MYFSCVIEIFETFSSLMYSGKGGGGGYASIGLTVSQMK